MKPGREDSLDGRSCASIVANARAALVARAVKTNRPLTAAQNPTRTSLAGVKLPPLKLEDRRDAGLPPNQFSDTRVEKYIVKKQHCNLLVPPATAPSRILPAKLPPLRPINGLNKERKKDLDFMSLRFQNSTTVLDNLAATPGCSLLPQLHKKDSECNINPDEIKNNCKDLNRELPRRSVSLTSHLNRQSSYQSIQTEKEKKLQKSESADNDIKADSSQSHSSALQSLSVTKNIRKLPKSTRCRTRASQETNMTEEQCLHETNRKLSFYSRGKRCSQRDASPLKRLKKSTSSTMLLKVREGSEQIMLNHNNVTSNKFIHKTVAGQPNPSDTIFESLQNTSAREYCTNQRTLDSSEFLTFEPYMNQNKNEKTFVKYQTLGDSGLNVNKSLKKTNSETFYSQTKSSEISLSEDVKLKSVSFSECKLASSSSFKRDGSSIQTSERPGMTHQKSKSPNILDSSLITGVSRPSKTKLELSEFNNHSQLQRYIIQIEQLYSCTMASGNKYELAQSLNALKALILEDLAKVKNGKLNDVITKALGSLTENAEGEIGVRILQILYTLNLKGRILEAVCRNTFRLVKNPKNIQLFVTSNVIKDFVTTLGSTNPIEDAEACAWSYASAEILGRTLAEDLVQAGLVEILRLHLYLLNSAREDVTSLPVAAVPAARRLTAAARILIRNDTGLKRFSESGLAVELIRQVSVWPACEAEAFLSSRVLSAASDSSQACAAIVPSIECLAQSLLRHTRRRDIVVRLAYCLGNVLARVSDAPKRLLFTNHGILSVAQCFEYYLSWDLKLTSQDGIYNDDDKKLYCDIEDVLVKIVRVVANMALDPEVSRALVGVEGLSLGQRLLDGLLEVVKRKGSASTEMVSGALAAVANFAFGAGTENEGPLAKSGIHFGKAILPLLVSGPLAADAARALANLSTAVEVREYAGESGAAEMLTNLIVKAAGRTYKENRQFLATKDDGPSDNEVDGLNPKVSQMDIGVELLQSNREVSIVNLECKQERLTAPGKNHQQREYHKTSSEDLKLDPRDCLLESNSYEEAGEAAVGALVNLLKHWPVRPLFARIGGPSALVAFLSAQPIGRLAFLTCQALANFASDSSSLRKTLGKDADLLEDILDELLSEAYSSGDSEFLSVTSDILKQIKSPSNHHLT